MNFQKISAIGFALSSMILPGNAGHAAQGRDRLGVPALDILWLSKVMAI
jgi:hypothetical protein